MEAPCCDEGAWPCVFWWWLQQDLRVLRAQPGNPAQGFTGCSQPRRKHCIINTTYSAACARRRSCWHTVVTLAGS